MKRNNGFSLIELLVVLAIIGTLLTLIFISFRDSRARARDARRTSDIRSFQDALAIYQIHNASYPMQTTEEEIIGSDTLSQALLGEKLILGIIQDPSPLVYKYYYQSDGKIYTLRYCQETDSIKGLSQDCENRAGP